MNTSAFRKCRQFLPGFGELRRVHDDGLAIPGDFDQRLDQRILGGSRGGRAPGGVRRQRRYADDQAGRRCPPGSRYHVDPP